MNKDGTVNFETCKPWSKSGGPGTKNNAGGPATQVVHMMCVTVSRLLLFSCYLHGVTTTVHRPAELLLSGSVPRGCVLKLWAMIP